MATSIMRAVRLIINIMTALRAELLKFGKNVLDDEVIL